MLRSNLDLGQDPYVRTNRWSWQAEEVRLRIQVCELKQGLACV